MNMSFCINEVGERIANLTTDKKLDSDLILNLEQNDLREKLIFYFSGVFWGRKSRY